MSSIIAKNGRKILFNLNTIADTEDDAINIVVIPVELKQFHFFSFSFNFASGAL